MVKKAKQKQIRYWTALDSFIDNLCLCYGGVTRLLLMKSQGLLLNAENI